MKILVTGAGGMLGSAVLPALERAGHVVGAILHPQDAPDTPLAAAGASTRLDITDYPALLEAARTFRPDWVVHLAAWTDVDGCEGDPDRAFIVNGLGARNAALAAAEAGAAVLAMSTDYVFDGSTPAPRREHDPKGPLNVYGRSKLAGEHAVREVNARHVIVRTAWLYGAGGRNFVDTILSRARSGQPLRVVDDQRGSPTWTADLADAIVALQARREFGTYHVTNTGEASWRDLAVAACELAGVRAEVARMGSAELDRPARRPAYSALHTGWYEHVTGRRMPHWRDALGRYLHG